MARFTKIDVVAQMKATGMVPVFYHADIEILLRVGGYIFSVVDANVKRSDQIVSGIVNTGVPETASLIWSSNTDVFKSTFLKAFA